MKNSEDKSRRKPPENLYYTIHKDETILVTNEGIEKGSNLYEEPSKAFKYKVKDDYTIFLVEALEMYEDGNMFYVTEDDVWTTKLIPSKYIKFML